MTKKEYKDEAKNRILDGISARLMRMEYGSDMWIEMDKQFRMIEKRYGYVEGSCIRGC